MTKLVISYRRSDTAAIAGRIFDRLVARYGTGSVFMDIDSIPFGIDFREHINGVMADCDALIAIVGSHWLRQVEPIAPTGSTPIDFVQVEIEAALQRKIPVVPVLVDGAQMPAAEQLPESLRDFTFRNAAEVSTGRDFHSQLDRLIRSMDQLLKRTDKRQRQLPFASFKQLHQRRLLALTLGIGVAMVAIAAAYTYWPLASSVRIENPAASSVNSPVGDLRSGEVTLLDGWKNYDQSGFNFRTARVVGWNSLLGDILVAKSDNGHGEPFFFLPGTQTGVSTDNQGDVVRAGIVEQTGTSFAQLKTCPTAGFNYGWFKPRIAGVFCVRVRDGNSYAKIAVREIQNDRIRFEWIYNVSGEPRF